MSRTALYQRLSIAERQIQTTLGHLVREAMPVEPEAAAAAGLQDYRPRFRLSTEGEATDGHIVRQFWDLSRMGTVQIPVLYNHKRDHHLGRWDELVVEGEGADRALYGRAVFDVEDEEGARVAGKVRRGFVPGVSVNWIPGAVVRRSDLPKTDPLYREPMEDECGLPAEGYVMGTEEEPNVLMEASIVTVAADASAYVTERTERAAKALARELPASLGVKAADLGSLLDGLAADPRVRTWARSMIRQELRAERAASTSTPTTPTAPTLGDILAGRENA